MSTAPLLAVIGDVHAHWRRLDRVIDRLSKARLDGVLMVGDLACAGPASCRTPSKDRKYRAGVDEVLRRVRALGVPVLWVPGNHDHPDLDGEGHVDGKVAELTGLRVAGIGGAGPERFGFCYEWGDDEIAARRVPDADILLCHAPPGDTPLDRTYGGHHAGSYAIRDIAESRKAVLVCGHIHEAPGVFRLRDCLCLNAGGLGEPFGRAQVGFIRGRDTVFHEDLEDGEIRRLDRA